MDPYLENPLIFPDFHDRFVSYLSEALQPKLPEPYYAGLGRRAWVEISERFVGPDVNVVRDARRMGPDSGGVAVAERSASEPIVVHVPHDERVETLVEIFVGRGEKRRLVTAIELPSPTNKTPGEQGRDLYLRKQREVVQSKAHFIEIDLLRGGTHTTAVPLDRLQRKVAPFDYHVCSHRFDNFEDYFIYPIRLPQSLPVIQVPLLPEDGEVQIDLQAVMNRTYDAGPYRREIDYGADPVVPPLPDEYARWCAEQVKGGR
jgi:hypothetical protein